VPAEAGDCGVRLTWPDTRIDYDVERDGVGAADVVARAFDAWASVDCGGGAHPDLRIARVAAHSVVRIDARHALDGRLAATDLAFDRGTGAIRRATMTFFPRELAPYQDVPLALALHEAGHFLGLAHSNVPHAVMAGEVDEASLARVALTDDDIAAVCTAYPPNKPPRQDARGLCIGVGIAVAGALAWFVYSSDRTRPHWLPRGNADA